MGTPVTTTVCSDCGLDWALHEDHGGPYQEAQPAVCIRLQHDRVADLQQRLDDQRALVTALTVERDRLQKQARTQPTAFSVADRRDLLGAGHPQRTTGSGALP